jgi:hypothetical protein
MAWILALVLACSGGEAPAECEELGELCHEAGETNAEAEACHEFGHEEGRTAEECVEKMAECEDICTPADTDTDAM